MTGLAREHFLLYFKTLPIYYHGETARAFEIHGLVISPAYRK